MDEDQYLALCKACDRVLLMPDATVERLAIPWLHVVRAHPIFTNKYIDLFGSPSVKSNLRKWLRKLRNFAGWLKQLIIATRSDGRLWSGSQEFPDQIDVLLISHLLSVTQVGRSDDFYFSSLANDLVAQGFSVVIALINHTDQPAARLADGWKGSNVPRIVLSSSLNVLAEIELYHRLRKEALRLKILSQKEVDSLARGVLLRAADEALSGSARGTLRMFLQFRGLVAKVSPKAIAVTYEGHAWERTAFAAARTVSPAIRCIGYQHSALFRLQHAIRRKLSGGYNPDHILTSGKRGKEALEQTKGLGDVKISVIGSTRAIIVDDSNLSVSSVRNVCLVLPEGLDSECRLLFKFSLLCAQACPDISFIWRLHPDVTFKYLMSKNSEFRRLPDNIILSEDSLEKDFARSCWSLYRGTTAIIQAVGAGVRPIYFTIPGELNIDPLAELNDWRITVSKTDDFKRFVEIDQGHSTDDESGYQLARKFCSDLFTPFNARIFENAIFEPQLIKD